jgi:hypothetical protein
LQPLLFCTSCFAQKSKIGLCSLSLLLWGPWQKFRFAFSCFVFIFALLLPRLPQRPLAQKKRGSKQRNKETKVEKKQKKRKKKFIC